MKSGLGFVIACILGALIALGSTSFLSILTYQGCGARGPTTTISSQPTVERLEKLGHLITHRVQIADAMIAENNRYKGSWIIKGDALIGIDMREAKIELLDEVNRKAKITLPLPHVMQPRVDHNRTFTWSVESNSWINYIPGTSGNPDRLREHAMKAAQEIIEKTANSTEHIQEAQQRAEALINGFYAEFGWSVEIAWPTRTVP